jgi:hypothetical protein
MRLLRGFLVALVLGAAGCIAEEVTLLDDVFMRGERVMVFIKAGTSVEVVSRSDSSVTIRQNGQVGSIPASSVPSSSPEARPAEAAAPDVPASVLVTPAIVMGPQTLFLANSPEDSPDGLREYIPDVEDLNDWQHMASTRVLKNVADPQAYLAGVHEAVAKADPEARFHLGSSSGENVLEITTKGDLPNRIHFIQWSLTRASAVAGGDLMVYQYAVRYFSYGDATAGKINDERTVMLLPFVASSSFEELTTILKPHDVKLIVKTDATVESTFPRGTFLYSPDVSLDFAGNMPGGIDIPIFTTQDGHVRCGAGIKDMLVDSRGAGISTTPILPSGIVGPRPGTFNGKGAFRLHTEELFRSQFALHTAGVYTLMVYCYLRDGKGDRYTLVGSQAVTIVDSRASGP